MGWVVRIFGLIQFIISIVAIIYVFNYGISHVPEWIIILFFIYLAASNLIFMRRR